MRQKINVQMNRRFFEDLKVGDRFKSQTYEVTEEQIISFAREFDPQPFHLERAVADKTMFEGLIASGWHTAAITMRLFVQTLNFAEGAIGLGVDELRWPTAVKPDDVLQVEDGDRRSSRVTIQTQSWRGAIALCHYKSTWRRCSDDVRIGAGVAT